jgi:predicted restriction endonuclease
LSEKVRQKNGCERRPDKESPHSEVCDTIKFSTIDMHDMMKLRLASSGQSLPDYLTERGFMGTFKEQLEKIGAIEVKREETFQVTKKRSPMKEREVRI